MVCEINITYLNQFIFSLNKRTTKATNIERTKHFGAFICHNVIIHLKIFEQTGSVDGNPTEENIAAKSASISVNN